MLLTAGSLGVCLEQGIYNYFRALLLGWWHGHESEILTITLFFAGSSK
jgi:hypothetical protein